MRRGQYPFRRRKGWSHLRSPQNVDGRTGAHDPPLHRRTDRIHRPGKRCPRSDVNTNEQTMAWIMDTYSMHMRQTVTAVVTGKPINIGGSRRRREATGRGVLMVCEQAIKKLRLNRDTTRVIVQGFGNVGSNAALLMHQAGYKVIGIGEVGGGLHNKNGIDLKALVDFRQKNGTVHG